MALPTKITLEIVTPERSLVTTQVDELPEQAFYMVGTIEEAVEKARAMKAA